MLLPDKATLDHMRQCYPAGTRVRLHHMGDPLAPPPGTLGTVEGIDDTGNILVLWDNGSTLNVVYGVDYCQPVNRAVYIPLPAERRMRSFATPSNTSLSWPLITISILRCANVYI